RLNPLAHIHSNSRCRGRRLCSLVDGVKRLAKRVHFHLNAYAARSGVSSHFSVPAWVRVRGYPPVCGFPRPTAKFHSAHSLLLPFLVCSCLVAACYSRRLV